MTLFTMRILLFTAEALAVSTLLPLLGFLVTPFFRGHAARRHLFWLMVFAVLLALPVLALVLPAHVLTLQPAPMVPVVVTMAAPVTAAYADNWSLEAIIAFAFAPLCVLWFAGMLFHLARLALGAWGLHRLKAKSEVFAQGILLGDGGPLTFGWLKPIILLPRAARHWPRERLEAVLRHERAHIARRDSLTQMLANLACAFYWPNPLVWLGARRLRRDAEIAADDAVLASGLQASAYATELVQMAAEFKGRPRLMAVAPMSVAMATPSTLEARVTSVLSPTPSRKGVSRMDALKLAALGSVAACALALARPDLAMAQVTSRPLPAPSVQHEDRDVDVEVESDEQAPVAAHSRHGLHTAQTPPAPVAPLAPLAPVMAEAPPAPPAPPMPVFVHSHEIPSTAQIDAMMARAHAQASAAIARAKAESERALSAERMEEIVSRAQERADQAGHRYDQAMERADRHHVIVDGEDVTATVHQEMVKNRPDMARIVADVRVQVANAMAQARISRDVALSQARVQVDAAIAQARAQAHEAVAHQRDLQHREDVDDRDDDK